ncbi:collagen-like protein [Oligoflexia bacterium]|nr:collagen-like protein [Oligoflexia bacterium]
MEGYIKKSKSYSLFILFSVATILSPVESFAEKTCIKAVGKKRTKIKKVVIPSSENCKKKFIEVFDSANFVVKSGSDGADGTQGPKGATGPQGAKGDTGSQGPQGDVGPQGAKGDAGDQGPQGLDGSNGTIDFSQCRKVTAAKLVPTFGLPSDEQEVYLSCNSSSEILLQDGFTTSYPDDALLKDRALYFNSADIPFKVYYLVRRVSSATGAISLWTNGLCCPMN